MGVSAAVQVSVIACLLLLLAAMLLAGITELSFSFRPKDYLEQYLQDEHADLSIGGDETYPSTGSGYSLPDTSPNTLASEPAVRKKLRVAFADFWSTYDERNEQFAKALATKYVLEFGQISDQEPVDMLFFAEVGDSHKRWKATKRVFYTGENVRPNLDEADLSLTFDIMENEPRQMRLPLWIFYITWYGPPTPSSVATKGVVLPSILTLEGRKFVEMQQPGITMVESHAKGFRLELWPALVQRLGKQAISLGGLMTSPGYEPLPRGSEWHGVGPCKLQLAIENGVYPGYVTEKILQAYARNTVPVYYGSPSIGLDFNPASFLDVGGLSVQEAVDAIVALLNDPERMDRMLAEPPTIRPWNITMYEKRLHALAEEALMAQSTREGI